MLGRAAWFVVLGMLAGCVGESTPQVTPTTGDPAQAPQVGSLTVLVLTSEMLPLEGAQVLLQPVDRSLATDADGRAVFDEVEPGEYTVVAAKPGFKPLEPRGKVARVEADAFPEIKLTMEPVIVAIQGYHATSIFRGFVSCAASAGGSAITCGRGYMVGTTHVRDPNENSTHPLVVQSIQAQTAILESKWQPTIGGLASQMYLAINRGYTCTPACNLQDQMFGGGGPTPLRVTHPATTAFYVYVDKDAADYPKTAYVSTRAFCGSGCTASIMFQQPYDAYATVFYGEPAPAEFRAIPT